MTTYVFSKKVILENSYSDFLILDEKNQKSIYMIWPNILTRAYCGLGLYKLNIDFRMCGLGIICHVIKMWMDATV